MIKANFKKYWQAGIIGILFALLINIIVGWFNADVPGLLNLFLILGGAVGGYYLFEEKNWWLKL